MNRMRRSLFVLSMLMVLAVIASGCAPVRALTRGKTAAPEKVVRSFYDWYLAYPGSAVGDGAYRSSELLTEEFIEQVDALVASFDQGGYDPFLCAQDIPGDLIVDETVVWGDRANVVVHEVWNVGTEAEMVLDVEVELQRIGGAWKIADIAPRASDDGGQVELRRGQDLVVSLKGNVATGYTWEAVVYDEGILGQVGETAFTPESDALGAPGRQLLRFEGLDEGRTTLQLVYHRPWEDAEPERVFSVAVVVR